MVLDPTTLICNKIQAARRVKQRICYSWSLFDNIKDDQVETVLGESEAYWQNDWKENKTWRYGWKVRGLLQQIYQDNAFFLCFSDALPG